MFFIGQSADTQTVKIYCYSIIQINPNTHEYNYEGGKGGCLNEPKDYIGNKFNKCN